MDDSEVAPCEEMSGGIDHLSPQAPSPPVSLTPVTSKCSRHRICAYPYVAPLGLRLSSASVYLPEGDDEDSSLSEPDGDLLAQGHIVGNSFFPAPTTIKDPH